MRRESRIDHETIPRTMALVRAHDVLRQSASQHRGAGDDAHARACDLAADGLADELGWVLRDWSITRHAGPDGEPCMGEPWALADTLRAGGHYELSALCSDCRQWRDAR